jgi:adenine specific DNA methylase Mod
VEYDADIIFFIKKDKNVSTKRVLICDKNRQTGEEFKETLYVRKDTLELTPEHIEVTYSQRREL